MKVPRSESPWGILMLLAAVVSCEDSIGTSPEPADAADPTDPPAVAAAIDCTVRIDQGVLNCEGPAAPPASAGLQLHIVGGQGVYVQLTAGAVSYDAATETFQADITVQNLLSDPLGTPDGSTPTGIRVFFHTLPAVTDGTGSVGVSNADGSGTFTGSEQPYFEYDGMLASGATSEAKTWQWAVPATVEQFSFSVYVHADLPRGGGLYSRVTLGDLQTCALLTPGEVWCWGSNEGGVFGNGTLPPYPDAPSPTPVLGAVGLRLRSLSLAIYGKDWACGVTLPGDVYCWGSNNYGVLGTGPGSLTPLLVASGMGFSMVEAGADHVCGLTTAGTAYCWGANNSGGLGDGTTTDRTAPTAVLTSLTFRDIGAGDGHTCALEASGNIYCWGANLDGQLGDGTTNDHAVPDSVSGDLRFVRLSVGRDHTCAIATDGRPYCWGTGAEIGAGDDYAGYYVPTLVSGGLTVKHISAGFYHTCAVDESNAGWCWGDNGDGQLGTGSRTYTKNVPTAMAGGLEWHAITAEEEHSCGVTITNEIYCWGSNAYGQLGVPSLPSSPVPVKVQGLSPYAATQSPTTTTITADDPDPSAVGESVTVAYTVTSTGGTPTGNVVVTDGVDSCTGTVAGGSCTLALTTEGARTLTAVYGGNADFAGSAGTEPHSVRVTWVAVTAGEHFACGLVHDGRAFCWGENNLGQLGVEPVDPYLSTVPVAVSDWITFTSISAGSWHVCGLTAAGDAYCWGRGDFGALGVSYPPSCRPDSPGTLCSAWPLGVEVGTRLLELDAGLDFTCGIGADNATYCWGKNDRLQLGAASANTCSGQDCSLLPLTVSGGRSFATVSAGFWHTCAQDGSGNTFCWGSNALGQFGNGSTVTQTGTSSTATPEPAGGALQLAGVFTGVQTCGIDAGGAAWCWGNFNNVGQLGDGTFTGSLSPVQVAGGRVYGVLEVGNANNILGHNCGISGIGGLHCWGSNRGGQLGTTGGETCTFGEETFDCSSAPVQVSGTLTFQSVTSGNEFTCGVTTDGRAYCWGANGFGQLGNGTTAGSPVPVEVSAPAVW
jgi:alpha-tubulin suppressor-like RCC1 family protein